MSFSRSPHRCSGNIQKRISNSRPPVCSSPCPSPCLSTCSSRNVPFSSLPSWGYNPVEIRGIHLPGGATPILGRRAGSRDSTISSQQSPSLYKYKETTSLFKALSLTPQLKRRTPKKSSYSSSIDNETRTTSRCNASNASKMSYRDDFSFCTGDTMYCSNRDHINEGNSNVDKIPHCGHKNCAHKHCSHRSNRCRNRRCRRSHCGGGTGSRGSVLEVRVGEAGLVNRRANRRRGRVTSVRVSMHQDTWQCLPLPNSGESCIV